MKKLVFWLFLIIVSSCSQNIDTSETTVSTWSNIFDESMLINNESATWEVLEEKKRLEAEIISDINKKHQNNILKSEEILLSDFKKYLKNTRVEIIKEKKNELSDDELNLFIQELDILEKQQLEEYKYSLQNN